MDATPPLPTAAETAFDERWRCGDVVDWAAATQATRFQRGYAIHETVDLFVVGIPTASAFLGVFLSLHSFGSAFGWSLGAAALTVAATLSLMNSIDHAAKVAAVKILIATGDAWVEAARERGFGDEANPGSHPSLLAALDLDSYERCARWTKEGVWVEREALSHASSETGKRFNTRLSLFEKLCYKAALAFPSKDPLAQSAKHTSAEASGAIEDNLYPKGRELRERVAIERCLDETPPATPLPRGPQRRL